MNENKRIAIRNVVEAFYWAATGEDYPQFRPRNRFDECNLAERLRQIAERLPLKQIGDLEACFDRCSSSKVTDRTDHKSRELEG